MCVILKIPVFFRNKLKLEFICLQNPNFSPNSVADDEDHEGNEGEEPQMSHSPIRVLILEIKKGAQSSRRRRH
jgi:hypothetical protein